MTPEHLSEQLVDSIEIAGRHYITTLQLAEVLNVSPRTIARWYAANFGPPRVVIGKLRLFDVEKVGFWLSEMEEYPASSSGRAR